LKDLACFGNEGILFTLFLEAQRSRWSKLKTEDTRKLFSHDYVLALCIINPKPCGYINWRCRTAWSLIWLPDDQ
jgi:hypothetical protein